MVQNIKDDTCWEATAELEIGVAECSANIIILAAAQK